MCSTCRRPDPDGTCARRPPPELRSHPHKSYVIFFRYEGGVLEIMRVTESHRDLPPLFGEDEDR